MDTVLFAPGGRTLLSSGRDGKTILWEVPSGAVITTLQGDGEMRAAAFSPDGSFLAVAFADDMLREYDLRSLRSLRSYSAQAVIALHFSRHRRLLSLTGPGMALKLRDGRSGRLLQVLHGNHSNSGYGPAAFSQDGALIAVAERDDVVVFETATGERLQVLDSYLRAPQSLAFSPDDQAVAASCPSGVSRMGDVPEDEIFFWSARTGKIEDITTASASSVTFSPDGRFFACGTGGEIAVMRRGSRLLERSLSGHSSFVNGIAFSPDSKTIASAGDDRSVRLWNATTGALLRVLGGRVHPVRSISIVGNRLALSVEGEGYTEGTVRSGTLLFTLRPTRLLHQWNEMPALWNRLALSPDGSLLANSDSVLASGRWIPPRIRNLDTGTEILLPQPAARSDTDLFFDSTGTLLAEVSSDVRVIDPGTGAVLGTIHSPTDGWSKGAFSPDGSRVILVRATFGETAVSAWNWREGRMLWRQDQGYRLPDAEGFLAADFSPDGRTVATGGRAFESNVLDGRAEIREAASGKTILKLPFFDSPVQQVIYSPDGKRLAIREEDGDVTLWDPGTGKPVGRPVSHGTPLCMVFSAAGDVLAIGSEDGRVEFWDPQSSRIRSTLALFPTAGKTGPEDDWIRIRPDGTFEGSPGGASHLR